MIWPESSAVWSEQFDLSVHSMIKTAYPLRAIIQYMVFPACQQDRIRSQWVFLLIADVLSLLFVAGLEYWIWGVLLFAITRLAFCRHLKSAFQDNSAETMIPDENVNKIDYGLLPDSMFKTRSLVRVCAHFLLVVLVAVLVHYVCQPEILWQTFPTKAHFYTDVAALIDGWVEKISFLLVGPFVAVTIALNTSVRFIYGLIEIIPWPVLILLLSALAWRVGGWRHALWCIASLCFIGLFGFWEKAIDTASVVIASIIICVMLGIPIGIAAAKNRVVNEMVVPVLDFMQTMPSFVYLLPAVAFFSLGKPPAVVATVIFAMPPLIRLTSLGIREVPQDAREAMLANGASAWQLLVKAEIPLAWATILAGINQCVMLAVAMVVIASLIGSGGLGYDILYALQNVRVGEGILAGTAIVCIAIIFDRILRSSRKYDDER